MARNNITCSLLLRHRFRKGSCFLIGILNYHLKHVLTNYPSQWSHMVTMTNNGEPSFHLPCQIQSKSGVDQFWVCSLKLIIAFCDFHYGQHGDHSCDNTDKIDLFGTKVIHPYTSAQQVGLYNYNSCALQTAMYRWNTWCRNSHSYM